LGFPTGWSSCPHQAFAKRYAIAPDKKFVLWLEEGYNAIIFDLSEPSDDVSSVEELSFVT
jgi:hypothetical protein